VKVKLFSATVLTVALVFACQTPAVPGAIFDANTVIAEGVGLDQLKVGDHSAVITAVLGPCPNTIHYVNVTQWDYRPSFHVDFLVSDATGQIIEIRFDNGFPGKTENNIRLGSAWTAVAAGHSVSNNDYFVLTQADANANPQGADKVLYKVSFDNVTVTSSKFIDSKQGICYWMDADQKIFQIIVFTPH
jgi:hypothetical protein